LLEKIKISDLDNLPTVEGRRPASASPVMIAGAYSVRPNPAANANAAFWLRPFAAAVIKTISRRNMK
jgi:hypothetical protein